MNYRTTCPHCASVFRLGTDQLNAAQGWAQCGVCGAAFDARASLAMEDGSPLVAAEPPETVWPTPVAAVLPDAAPPAEVTGTSQSNPAEANEPLATASLEDEPQAATNPFGIAQRAASSDLSSIVIIDPDIPVPDDFGPMPEFHAEPASTSAAPLMYPPARAPEPATAATAPVTQIRYAPSGYVPPPPDLEVEFPGRRPRSRWWGGASVLLLLLLLAQSAYFLRDTLVVQLPQTRPAFERLCTVLGCTLSLPKNLALLQIVGSDLQTEAGNRLTLTLTLGNRASHAQAWPVLVLTLTDQRDRPLARRSFAPSEYLDDAGRIAAGIPPRSEQALSLPLAVRDLTPMGFDLQLTY